MKKLCYFLFFLFCYLFLPSCNQQPQYPNLTPEEQLQQDVDNRVDKYATKIRITLTVSEFKSHKLRPGEYIILVNDGTPLDSLNINTDSVTIICSNLVFAEKPLTTSFGSKVVIDGHNTTFTGINVRGNYVTLVNFGVKGTTQYGLKWVGSNGYCGNFSISSIGFNYFTGTDSILFSQQVGVKVFGVNTTFNKLLIDSTSFDAFGVGCSGVVIKNSTFTNIGLAGHTNGDGIQLYEDVVPQDAEFTLINSYIRLQYPIKHCLLGHNRIITAIGNTLMGGSTGVICGKNSVITNNTIMDQKQNLYTGVKGRGIVIFDITNVICEGNTISNDDTGILIFSADSSVEDLENDNVFINCIENVAVKH